MKKTLLLSSIIYAILAIVSVIFLFNNFTSSAEANFIFRIISAVFICYIASYPLLLATSINIDPPTWAKILLYIGYVILEVGSLFFAYKTFNDKNFMFNVNLTEEAFKNSQINLTSSLLTFSLLTAIGMVIILSIKLGKMWNDWTFFLLIPFASALVGIAIFGLVIMLVYRIFKGLTLSSSISTSSSYSSYYSSNSDPSDYDVHDSSSERHGISRSPGENYYDGNGVLRSPGENYYDGNGVLRSPGENYYDGNGVLRSPGENYYDGNGVLRSPDENYYDGGN